MLDMNSFEAQVLRELGEIKVLCATNQADNKATTARVSGLEKTNTRQWWIHAAEGVIIFAVGVFRGMRGH
jgi:hypothetical protein